MNHNKIIISSAGSGKTYQLVSEYIKLISNGVPIHKIVALTFTTKATKDILNNIITRLIEEYNNKSKNNKYIENILQNPNNIQVSTLDSFFTNTLRKYANEFGLNSQFTIEDKYQDNIHKNHIINSFFEDNNKEKNIDIMLNYKNINLIDTHGVKSVRKIIESVINDYYIYYIQNDREDYWRIPEYDDTGYDNFIKNSPFIKIDNNIFNSLPDPIQSIMEKIISELRDFTIYSNINNISKNSKKHFDSIIQQISDKKSEITIICDRKRVILPDHIQKLLRDIVTYISNLILFQQSKKLQIIYMILKRYDEIRNLFIRRNNKLAVIDVLKILKSGKDIIGSDESNLLQKINYELYNKYDYWLIDEFQDTSIPQWNIIKNIVHEIINNIEDDKKVLIVGDAKQSIYHWRGGDTDLLIDTYEKYKFLIKKEYLNTSYRSYPEIIDTVNEVFGNINEKQFNMSKKMLNKWNSFWENHNSKVSGNGFVQLSSNTSDILEDIAQTIKNILTVKEDVSIGIIVSTNNECEKISKYLSYIPHSLNHKVKLTDNVIISLFISFLQFIYDPTDTIAYEHIAMSPLATIVDKYNSKMTLFLNSLKTINQKGFNQLISELVDELSKTVCIYTEIDKRYIENIKILANDFDETNNKNCLDFINYIKSYETTLVQNNKIEIMTIHKSKGLEFDVVILPMFKGQHVKIYDQLHDGIKTYKTTEGEYCMLLPRRSILQSVNNKVINEIVSTLDDIQLYEQLCNLYVAMTRAKKALYMYIEVKKNESSVLYTSTILKKLLLKQDKEVYRHGYEDWYKLSDN